MLKTLTFEMCKWEVLRVFPASHYTESEFMCVCAATSAPLQHHRT